MPLDVPSPIQPEAVVAGTLCLMSCFAQARSPRHAQRIATNLDLLARDAGVTAEMRTLCRRLAQRWDAIALDMVTRGESEPVDLNLH